MFDIIIVSAGTLDYCLLTSFPLTTRLPMAAWNMENMMVSIARFTTLTLLSIKNEDDIMVMHIFSSGTIDFWHLYQFCW